MSATLVASGLTVVRAARTVLEKVDLTLSPGTRLGVLGPNGVGKSTLFGALAGLIELDAGSVTLAPPSASVGLLPQEPAPVDGETLAGYLGRRTGVTAATAAMDAAAEALGSEAPGADDAYSESLETWLALGGADLDVRTLQVCADLGLDPGLIDVEMSGLSGGQAARAALASVLLSRFDITLLDEPTNDLDFAGLERLERFVTDEIRGAVAIISHDREFLSRSISSVLEIDRHNHGILIYEGGWEAYLTARDVARRQARDQYEQYADKRESLVIQAQRQREQSVRGALRAKRKRPDNDKSVASYKLEAATHAASRVKAVESRLDQLEVVEEPRKEWQLKLSLAVAPRSGDVVATLRGAVVSRPGFTLGPVDLTVSWADRIALTGPNGAGKTTLLKALLGEVELSAGTSTLGSGVVVGGVDQARSRFRGDATVVDVVEHATQWPTGEVRTLLAKFGLGADHVNRPAGSLSPGERTRAGLSLLQGVGTNLLVLDEPTNHLDVPAIEQLEEALLDYPGTLLLVSHDRRMLDAVRFTRRLHVENGTVTELLV